MRIDTLSVNNRQTQGAERRTWLRANSPAHLEQSRGLVEAALHVRDPAASRSIVVLGAGACTEIPLAELARAGDEVMLVDLDLSALQRARDELPAQSLQRLVHLLQGDLTGGVSANLDRLLQGEAWEKLAEQGERAFFDAAAQVLDECTIPDPPEIDGLAGGEFGLAISALVMTQLFSYPLLDSLDLVQRVAPHLLEAQERQLRYQQAARAFRERVIQSHLHLLRSLMDRGGVVAMLTDIRGFAFTTHDTDRNAALRRAIPLVPHSFFDLVRATFTIRAELRWEWISDLPDSTRPGRGYEVAGYVLQ